MSSNKPGKVYLVGAGPGDPELVTLKTHRLLEECDAVVYDNLIPDELILDLAPDVEKHYVGKRSGVPCVSQEFINDLLVGLASAGKQVVRLKGSDPLIFGRGAEEAKWLRKHEIPFEIVPGVTSGLAASAYSGIPCTDRERASTVILVTGHKSKDKDHSSVDWSWVARAKEATIIIYMGVREMPTIAAKLIDNGMDPKMPSAVVERCTFPTQRVFTAPLDEMPRTVEENDVGTPAIFLIGRVVELREWLHWFNEHTLMGTRIMVTRPADQAQPIWQRLRELGAEVMTYPTIATDELLDEKAWERFLAADPVNGWLIFTSENGVRYFMQQLAAHDMDVRALAKYKIAVVGGGTERFLKQYNLHADFVPNKATGRSLAAELTAAVDLSGATVVRVRGNLSYDFVDNAVVEKGATLIPMTVYATSHPIWPDGMKQKLAANPPHVVLFTSGSSVDGLYENMTGEEIRETISPAMIVSIGPTTSEEIRKRGLEVDLEAAKHTIPDMIDELVTYLEQNPPRRK